MRHNGPEPQSVRPSDDETPEVYPHDEVFGKYITINDYIDCPPDELYAYMADTHCLEEWTYSLRGFTETDEPGLWLAYDRLGSETRIYTRTRANEQARTVDYQCAWDQGKHLWMVYLMRVIDAQEVFDKPGSVVLWTNCHHPFYDRNPYADAAPPERPVWVGDFWDMFAAGHLLECIISMMIGVAFSRGLVSMRVKPSIGLVLPVWAAISSSAGSGIGSVLLRKRTTIELTAFSADDGRRGSYQKGCKRGYFASIVCRTIHLL
jgi:hypothetical protein